ncbi:MAG: RecQ family ATP-dependent DNA helicase [Collinsella sp.]|nr:RecQ family ATP-dependent DNA helicase [Collinsella sp.]
MDRSAEVMERAHETLKRYFGYGSFRPGQERMVRAILEGRDALGIMPTGAGKSICYQVPALMSPGITFVVSPLVSLMGDQVRSLKAAGARPSFLNSTLTPAQQNTVLKRAAEGWYQIMYVAPERLCDPRFLDFARQAASDSGIGVPLVAVDEAHCVSQWGQDFRPSYLQIADFVAGLPHRPVVAAFTATATDRVRLDIADMLGLVDPETVSTGFDRPNLFFGVEELGDKEKARWIEKHIRSHPKESGIVYCSTRKAVDELSADLARDLGAWGIRVGRYHAGMMSDERAKSQADFIDDRITVMVATNAFGMGIDKPNVRYVIHNNAPESIEAYYQEAGRAGRDGDPSSCFLLWNGNDFRLRRYLIDREPDDDSLDEGQRARARQNRYRLLSQMEGYCKTAGCLRGYILRYFGGDRLEGGLGRAVDPEGCGACSNCRAEYESEDVTPIARAIMGFVALRPGRFGKTLIAEALHGSRSEKIRACHLDQARGYSSLADEPVKRIKDVVDQLVGSGYLAVLEGQYPVIGLGARADGFSLEEGGDFRFTMKRRAASRGAKRIDRALDMVRDGLPSGARDRIGDDAELFENLRTLRTELARERGWAPYMVFSDAALRGMCRKRPVSREDLLEISGIGERKADTFGEEFLQAISRFESELR